MGGSLTFLILLLLGVLVGAVFGWIAFFRTNTLRREVVALKAEIDALRRRLDGTAAPRPAAKPQATPPQPTPQSASKSTSVPATSPPAPATPPSTLTAKPPASPVAASIDAGAAAAAASSPADGMRTVLEGVERRLAGNWMIWIAGLAIALGGVFLAAFAIEQQWIGPRVWVALAALLGLGVVGASEWLRRSGVSEKLGGEAAPEGVREGVLGHALAPPITAAAGLVIIYAAFYAGSLVEPPVPPIIAMIGLVAVAAGAVALALLHGPLFVVLGLVGAFVAPILIGSDDPRAWSLFLYVFAVVIVGLAVTRLVGRRWPSLVALGGGALWPLLWFASGGPVEQAWALGLYLPALLVAAVAFAWDLARDAARPDPALDLWSDAPVSIGAAHLAAIVVFVLSALLALHVGHDEMAIASLAASTLIAMIGPWRREGFLGLPLIAAAGVALTLYIWPEGATGVITDETRLDRATGAATPAGPNFLRTCLGFMALFGVGGLVMQDRLRVKAVMAVASAGAPAVILAIAFWRTTGLGESFEQNALWAVASLLLAGANLFVLERIARTEGGVDAQPGAASAYAIGAAAAAGLAVGMALDHLWMSVGFAVIAPICALLYGRFKLRALAWAAVAFAVLAAARLTVFGEVFSYTPEELGRWPILNWLLLGYGVPAAAAWWSARRFERAGFETGSRTVQSLDGAALILGVALVSMQIRHAMNGGEVGALGYYRFSLAEVGLQTSAWLGAALALRWRLGPKLYFVHRWIERLLIFAGLFQLVVMQLWLINPWWGVWLTFARGTIVLNSLLLAYAIPAALAAAYAIIVRRQGYARIATIASSIAMFTAFIWTTLEVRRLIYGEEMTWEISARAAASVQDAERFAYSGAWLVFAAVLLALGIWRKRPSLRYGSLLLLVVVTLKVFIDSFFDLGLLLQAVSLFALGAVLLGIFVLYQRIIPRLLGEDGEPPAPSPEPEPAPTGAAT
jgi:uncharacterized membrane protein